MKIDLKTRRGKLILYGSLATVAVVGTAIAVPVALLVPSSAAELTADQKELADFVAKYPGTIDQTGGMVAVKENAFADRTDLPADFALPSLVTSIKASAFKNAVLPTGFDVPAKAADLDLAAFDEAILGDGDWWDTETVAAGSKIVPVEQSAEYKRFDSLYPGTLEKRNLKDEAFLNRTD